MLRRRRCRVEVLPPGRSALLLVLLLARSHYESCERSLQSVVLIIRFIYFPRCDQFCDPVTLLDECVRYKGFGVEIVPIFHSLFSRMCTTKPYLSSAKACTVTMGSNTSPHVLRFTVSTTGASAAAWLEYAFLTNAAATVRSVGAMSVRDETSKVFAYQESVRAMERSVEELRNKGSEDRDSRAHLNQLLRELALEKSHAETRSYRLAGLLRCEKAIGWLLALKADNNLSLRTFSTMRPQFVADLHTLVNAGDSLPIKFTEAEKELFNELFSCMPSDH